MTFSKDFWKRLEEKRWNALSDEEKQAELKRKEELKSRILYREDIDIHHPHYGINNNIINATAIITIDSDKRYLLEFVDRSDREYAYKSYWGYFFDKRFIERLLNREYDSFWLDAGSDITIEAQRMKELVKNARDKLVELNIALPYDYFPEVTENILKGTALY